MNQSVSWRQSVQSQSSTGMALSVVPFLRRAAANRFSISEWTRRRPRRRSPDPACAATAVDSREGERVAEVLGNATDVLIDATPFGDVRYEGQFVVHVLQYVMQSLRSQGLWTPISY